MDNEIKDITVGVSLGRRQMTVKVGADSTDAVRLDPGVWNYGALVSALVRHRYSESEVEAIVSNGLLLLGDSGAVSEDEKAEKLAELNEFQSYRETCKARARELLALGEEMGLEVTNPVNG